MNRPTTILLCAATLLGISFQAELVQAAVGTLADSSSQIVAWGGDSYGLGTTNAPSGTFTAIAAGNYHSLGIKSDGTLAGWGDNYLGQTNVPFGTFTAIAAGIQHGVGIKSDGTLAGWGSNYYGQITVPVGTFIAIAAGNLHSLGIRSDGTLAGWGYNVGGETDVPSGTFIAIDAANSYSLGLRIDGTLAIWGSNANIAFNVPTGTFAAIAAGQSYALVIKSDGSLAGWGSNSDGQTIVPGGTFAAVAAGYAYGLGIRSDGTLAGWGDNTYGQTAVPSGTFTAIAAGVEHSLALRGQTDYTGDLLVNYTGSANGPNGLKANLNRSVTVAGNALIQSPMILSNNPLLSVAGKVSFSGTGSVTGTGTIAAGGGLEISSGAVVHIPSTVAVSAAGPLMGGGILFLDSASLTTGLTPASYFSGLLQIYSGSTMSFTGAGLVAPHGLFLQDATTNLRIAAGQHVQVVDGTTNAGRIEVLGNGMVLGGTAEFDAGGYCQNSTNALITGRDAVLRFEGGLTNTGSVSLTAGANDVFGDIANNVGGKIVVTGGASATFYDDIVQNGTFQVSKVGSKSSTAVILGSFTGAGGTTGGGDIFFEGDLRPGNSPASVTFNNNVSFGPGSTLKIELGGTEPGTQYDQVHVTGQLALGGALEISLVNGFIPPVGARFDILDWGSLSGAFATIQLPTLGGTLAWNTSQLLMGNLIGVVPALAGDYNADGVVDAADYVVWRKTLGSTSNLAADGNLNNQIDAGDLTVWRAHFGQTLSSGTGASANAAVPEPASVAIALVGLLGILHVHRPREFAQTTRC